VDEGADLGPKLVPKEQKQFANICQNYLSEIARKGGGLGYRLIYATQYPTVEAVPNQIKINMAARLSFYIGEPIGSRVILDSNDAAEIEPIPGRAIYKLAKKTEIQSPWISDKMIGGYLHELSKNGTDIISD
jgi:S-DNA-T family DNA segregation ATPase FtsK/SpoIIIE